MKIFYCLVIFLFSVTVFSCSSGKKAYEKGNYAEAVMKAVNRLRKNPGHKKSKETLRGSYPSAISYLESQASNALASNSPFRYTEALRSYQDINYLGDEIRRSPGALSVIPNPKFYNAKIEELKQLAAKENYDAAMVLMKRNTRVDAREAYILFRNAHNYVPNYKDVVKQMDDALFKATLKVLVEQIPVPARYNLSGGYFQDRIEEYLHTQFRGSEFVRFYTQKEADVQNLPYVDQYLRLQFDDFVVGETHTTKIIETVTKDSVVVGTVKLEDGTKANVYNTVSAKITILRKEVISRGLFSMQVFDAQSNAMLHHRKFNPESVWFSTWGSFNGDERALSDEQFQICQNTEVPPPPPQELFVSFAMPIYDQLIPNINEYYSRF